MSTITKEWLQQTIAEMEEHRDLFPGDLDDNHENVLAALRIALASLEAKPVSVFKIDHESSLIKHVKRVVSETNAPPAPVSVPEWTNEQCLEFLSIAFRHAEIKGDLELDDIRLGVKMVNGSRAAMLQGADGNSPVIPDGWVMLPAEPTEAMMNAWLSEVANWRGHAAGYRAMIAAAPLQEVK
ncbi:hypothetical protein [Enterobacter cloacae]|uniref:hypothetical protein n=1 Tax=Enterobacter cloacae TaxID=550 RepID=UPI003D6FF9AB